MFSLFLTVSFRPASFSFPFLLPLFFLWQLLRKVLHIYAIELFTSHWWLWRVQSWQLFTASRKVFHVLPTCRILYQLLSHSRKAESVDWFHFWGATNWWIIAGKVLIVFSAEVFQKFPVNKIDLWRDCLQRKSTLMQNSWGSWKRQVNQR